MTLIFLGTTFFGGRHTMDPLPTNTSNITSFTLTDGTYGHFYVSRNPEMNVSNIDADWNLDTVLNARFENNLEAGNSEYSLRTTDTLLIRMRERNTPDWHIIKTIPVREITDFNFTFIYKYCRNNTWYEFALVSTCLGIENSSISKMVYSSFEGLYLMDALHTFGSIYDIRGFQTTRNISQEVVALLHHKYASVYSNSDAAYESGSASASFLKLLDCHSLQHAESRILRGRVMDFLCNRRPKVIKTFDGRIWLIQITGTPADSSETNPLIRQISFDWVEIGNVYDTKAMSRHGLLEVDEKWRSL